MYLLGPASGAKLTHTVCAVLSPLCLTYFPDIALHEPLWKRVCGVACLWTGEHCSVRPTDNPVVNPITETTMTT